MPSLSELPEPIRKLAKERQGEIRSLIFCRAVNVNSAKAVTPFWANAKEGIEFWDEIFNGNFAPFYEKYPNGFPEPKQAPIVEDTRIYNNSEPFMAIRGWGGLTAEQSPIKYTVEYCKANKVAIHCETQEDFDKVSYALRDVERREKFDKYGKETCLYFGSNWYVVRLKFMKLCAPNYAIIPAAQFIADNTEQVLIEPVKKSMVDDYSKSMDRIMQEQHDLPKVKEHTDSEMLTWFKQYVKENPEQAKKEWDEICKEVERKPILTTEDEVRVFEGDEPYVINKEFKIFGPYNPSNYRVFFNAVMESGGKYFSTRAAAEDYVLKNKDCFSVADLMKFGIPIYESALINLAKNKLGING